MGDFAVKSIKTLPDPCPPAESKRTLKAQERQLYAPMSDTSGIVFDQDAVYISIPDHQVNFTRTEGIWWHSLFTACSWMADGPVTTSGPGEEMVFTLQDTAISINEKLQESGLQLFRQSKVLRDSEMPVDSEPEDHLETETSQAENELHYSSSGEGAAECQEQSQDSLPEHAPWKRAIVENAEKNFKPPPNIFELVYGLLELLHAFTNAKRGIDTALKKLVLMMKHRLTMRTMMNFSSLSSYMNIDPMFLPSNTLMLKIIANYLESLPLIWTTTRFVHSFVWYCLHLLDSIF